MNAEFSAAAVTNDAALLEAAARYAAAVVVDIVDPTIDPADLAEVRPVLEQYIGDLLKNAYVLGSVVQGSTPVSGGEIIDAEFVEIVEESLQ